MEKVKDKRRQAKAYSNMQGRKSSYASHPVLSAFSRVSTMKDIKDKKVIIENADLSTFFNRRFHRFTHIFRLKISKR
jgi:hypothetical protein